jgi:hypothetical protein
VIYITRRQSRRQYANLVGIAATPPRSLPTPRRASNPETKRNAKHHAYGDALERHAGGSASCNAEGYSSPCAAGDSTPLVPFSRHRGINGRFSSLFTVEPLNASRASAICWPHMSAVPQHPRFHLLRIVDDLIEIIEEVE